MAADWGIDPSRLAIGGDSAGANLALATLLSLRDAGATRCAPALLIYGAYDADADARTPSQRGLRRRQLHPFERRHALVLEPLLAARRTSAIRSRRRCSPISATCRRCW